jgi:hypothetical protein
MIQRPIQLDRITVGKTSLAYTKSAVNAQEIPNFPVSHKISDSIGSSTNIIPRKARAVMK